MCGRNKRSVNWLLTLCLFTSNKIILSPFLSLKVFLFTSTGGYNIGQKLYNALVHGEYNDTSPNFVAVTYDRLNNLFSISIGTVASMHKASLVDMATSANIYSLVCIIYKWYLPINGDS